MFSLIKDKSRSGEALSDPVLACIFEMTSEPTLIVSPAGHVTLANAAAARLLEGPADALFDRPVGSLFLGDSDPVASLPRQQRDSVMMPQKPARRTVRTLAGGSIEVGVRGCVVLADDGTEMGTVLTLHDQREANRLSSKLAITEIQLRQALDAAEEGAWSADIRTGIAKVSGRFATMLNLPAADDTRLHLVQFLEYVHPDDVDMVRGRMTALGAGEIDRFDDVLRIVTPEGGYRWARNRGRVIEHDDHDAPIRAAGLLRDIDVQKRLEIRAQETDHLFREAMLAVNQTLWATDFEAGVVRVEGPLVARLGKPGQSMVMTRERFRELVHPEDLARSTGLWQDIVDRGTDSFEFSGRMLDANGEAFPVHLLSRIAIRDPQNQPVRATGIIQILATTIDSPTQTSPLVS
jgi:PAS domain-containing protein